MLAQNRAVACTLRVLPPAPAVPPSLALCLGAALALAGCGGTRTRFTRHVDARLETENALVLVAESGGARERFARMR